MGTGRKTDRDDDLQREIRQHLELDAEEREAEGMAPTEARRAAAVAFGNVSAVREDARSVWWPLWLQHAGQDLRYAARVARRTPAFTCGAVLIFALGISTSTTVFSVLNAVVLAPLPFKQPDQLVRIVQANPARGVDAFSVSLPLLRDWQGLLLAVIGIYGVMSFVTRQRGREAAIRLALGATRRRVIGPLVREGALLVAAGALIGVAAAVPVITLMRTVIADIPSADPMMMAVSVLLLAAAAMLACYLPARRVSRVDPVTALRGD